MLGKGVNIDNNYFEKQFNLFDEYQIKNTIVPKTLDNNKLIKNTIVPKTLDNNKLIKNKNNSDSKCLIEYFHGIILNYISLNEEQGIKLDKLKNIILNYNNHKNNKLSGGDYNIKVHYPNHVDDNNIINFTPFDNTKNELFNVKINMKYGSEYKITIYNTQGDSNKINLIIDLYNNVIIDNITNSYNTSVWDNSDNINHVLHNIITTLIKQNHNDELFGFGILDENDNNIFNNNDEDDKNIIRNMRRGVISLFIMLLTIRKDVNVDVYKKYNNTFLLSGICKYNLFDDAISDIKEVYDKFSGCNYHILTYHDEKNLIYHGGDCALNSLMCVKIPEIRELFVDKITISQHKQKCHKPKSYYISKIKKILREMEILEDFDFIEKIENLIDDYSRFHSFIYSLSYSMFRNNILKGEYNDDEFNNWVFERLYYYLPIFIDICRNNLMDFDLTDEEINKIVDEINNYIDYYYQNEDNININNIHSYNNMAKNFIKILDIIQSVNINKNSYNIFYINLLLSLLITKYKINYLLNDNFANIFKYFDKKEYIIKRFENISRSRNELDQIFPKYQKGNIYFNILY